jgi:uncharacterized protein
MPASGGTKLADANVWLAVVFSDHLHHPQAKTWFEVQGDAGCGFCRVTQMALLRHLTNARIMGSFVQSQQDACTNYDKLASDPRVVFLSEPPALETAFRSFAQAAFPSHALWTDAYLAAFALEGQAQLVTFDQGFRRFAGLDLQVLG